MEKWLSLGTEMYDMIVFEEREATARRLSGRGEIRETESSGDGFYCGPW